MEVREEMRVDARVDRKVERNVSGTKAIWDVRRGCCATTDLRWDRSRELIRVKLHVIIEVHVAKLSRERAGETVAVEVHALLYHSGLTNLLKVGCAGESEQNGFVHLQRIWSSRGVNIPNPNH